MGGVVNVQRSDSQNPPPVLQQSKKNIYRLLMRVKNKKGSLAKVSFMLAKRQVGIETLDYKPSTKAGFAELNMTVLIDKNQLQGVLNDAKRMSEIKTAFVDERA